MGRQGFDTKRAAEAALAEAIGEVTRGAASRSSIAVGEYLAEWIEAARPSLRPTTARGCQQSVERLTARLGRVRLRALTPMQVQQCNAGLLESGGRGGRPLVPKTVRLAHVVLRKALGEAERLGVVSRNPAAAARPPTGEHTEMTTWSSEDLCELLDAVVGHQTSSPSGCSPRRACAVARCSVCAGATSTSTSARSPLQTRSPNWVATW